MIVLIMISATPILVAICGDKLLDKTRALLGRAIIDSFTHGLIGCLCWLVILFRAQYSRNYILNAIFEVVLSGFLASVIDLDHFIAARSFKLKDAVSLGVRRPPLHATSVLICVVILFLTIGKVIKKNAMIRLSFLILVAVGSHHIRDAVRRGLWFPPLGSTPPLPHAVYLAFIGLLPHIIFPFIPFHSAYLSLC
uniref:Transmembrane protein 267 n=1 Tax=Riptortus pedestris TaxID=329032 RepID=R4WSP9_RIPPE|nr:unkown protein [Riptortus pedestris]